MMQWRLPGGKRGGRTNEIRRRTLTFKDPASSPLESETMPYTPSFRARPAAMRSLLAAGLVLVALANGCASVTTTEVRNVAVYPGAEWERASQPRELGWSPEGLQAVHAKLATMPSTGFMAIVGGRVIMEYGDLEAVSYLASVRKSILSMLYGNYVANGTVRLDKTLAELGLDDHLGLTAAEKQATIRDLLAARSGVYHPASNSGDDLASAPPRGSQRPGTYYLYSNWDFNAVGAVFEQETGLDIYDALQKDLVIPLGMRDWDRASHRKSGNLSVSRFPAYHMNLSTRDMARIGYLMLREGNWNGRQLVPRDWVRESTSAITPVSEMNPARRRSGPWGYGYLWWVWDGAQATGAYEGAYTGLGAVGQHITVFPKLDLVVVHKTRPGNPAGSVSHDQYREVLNLLLAAHCGASCQ
jgi:CubicO group peptidase (beta-lactamase class C family)